MSGASYAAAGVDVEAGERAVALMRQSIEKMIGLSADICSDCVPRRYATDLTAQMDRVQTAGQKLRAHLHVP